MVETHLRFRFSQIDKVKTARPALAPGFFFDYTEPMNAQRGNILFLILLAVVLFAALSYAVMNQREGSKNASTESQQAIAAQIIQFGTLLENTVNRLKISNGCSDTQISFANTVFSGLGGTGTNLTNTNAPSDGRCNVFDPAGGGMSYPARLDDKYLTLNTWTGSPTVSTWYVNYRGFWTFNANTNGYPPEGYDLIVYVPFLLQSLCEEINLRLNGTKTVITNRDVPYPSISGFIGTYGASGQTRDGQMPARAGCVKKEDGYYSYYNILIAR